MDYFSVSFIVAVKIANFNARCVPFFMVPLTDILRMDSNLPFCDSYVFSFRRSDRLTEFINPGRRFSFHKSSMCSSWNFSDFMRSLNTPSYFSIRSGQGIPSFSLFSLHQFQPNHNRKSYSFYFLRFNPFDAHNRDIIHMVSFSFDVNCDLQCLSEIHVFIILSKCRVAIKTAPTLLVYLPRTNKLTLLFEFASDFLHEENFSRVASF